MVEKVQHFRAHGKLLLTGEYFVLDGALALACPCKLGQKLTIQQSSQTQEISWQSLDRTGQSWFEASFHIDHFRTLTSSDPSISNRLEQILLALRRLQPDALSSGLKITTQLEFPRLWGLGTSSTLISTLAQAFGVDPFLLLADSFGGSGYDIACAMARGPILFQKHQHLPPAWVRRHDPKFDGQFVDYPIPFHFKDHLYFVFLQKKQNSRLGIQHYRSLISVQKNLIEEATRLTIAFTRAQNLEELEDLIKVHEQFVSKHLQLPKAKDLYFQDYWGTVKSLGAWGGDFVLVTSKRSKMETINYFRRKGFQTILPYKELILE